MWIPVCVLLCFVFSFSLAWGDYEYVVPSAVEGISTDIPEGAYCVDIEFEPNSCFSTAHVCRTGTVGDVHSLTVELMPFDSTVWCLIGRFTVVSPEENIGNNYEIADNEPITRWNMDGRYLATINKDEYTHGFSLESRVSTLVGFTVSDVKVPILVIATTARGCVHIELVPGDYEGLFSYDGSVIPDDPVDDPVTVNECNDCDCKACCPCDECATCPDCPDCLDCPDCPRCEVCETCEICAVCETCEICEVTAKVSFVCDKEASPIEYIDVPHSVTITHADAVPGNCYKGTSEGDTLCATWTGTLGQDPCYQPGTQCFTLVPGCNDLVVELECVTSGCCGNCSDCPECVECAECPECPQTTGGVGACQSVIVGRVTRSTDGSPIKHAEIKTGGVVVASTDGDGFYTIRGAATGAYTYSSPGCISQTAEVEVVQCDVVFQHITLASG
ncbi:hypothetical protein KIPB_010825 [Kipferlia bialata]|uniref:Carboxypeptidase regulatory-like domain-containing protein n=1 Tax=Kipferlia bialata TaxID=797122 RepID=A0A9K3D550_9EUKA|nr:hypothetical protein KIPB_010825 [Kipferlia bialata]|eukprot:g10825.t1